MELQTSFKADQVQLFKNKDGAVTTAAVTFLNNRDAAAAWTYNTAPVVPLSIRKGAMGHLQVRKYTEEVLPPWDRQQAQVKAASL